MEHLSTAYLWRAEVWLFAATLVYFLMNGAQIFETLVHVPKWSSSLPESLVFLREDKGVSLKTFWIVFHSVHEIIFVVAIVLSWKIVFVRHWLILLFAIHFAVRVWTILYFAPNIIDFQRVAEGTSSGDHLETRVRKWVTWNYVRVAVFIAVSLAMIPLCAAVAQLI